MGWSFLGTEELMELDSPKAASTITGEEMAQCCPGGTRQSILCPLSDPNQTDREFPCFNRVFCGLSICLQVSELSGFFALWFPGILHKCEI